MAEDAGFNDDQERLANSRLIVAVAGLITLRRRSSKFVVIAEPDLAAPEIGKSIEQCRINLLRGEGDDLAAESVNSKSGLDVDIDEAGLAGTILFNQGQSCDNAPSVVRHIVTPAHVAMVELLRAEI